VQEQARYRAPLKSRLQVKRSVTQANGGKS
jgi:hypothetical protein